MEALGRMQVPFHADAFGGLGTVRGLLSFDGRQLRMSWESADALLGVIKSGPQQLDIPLTALEHIRCGLGWFWLNPFLSLGFNDFALSTRVPGAEGADARLRVRFRDRVALRKLVEAVGYLRSQLLHEALSVGLRQELPPPQPQIQPQTAVPESPPPLPRQLE